MKLRKKHSAEPDGYSGFHLANSVCYTRPEKIFLFGGLAQSGDLLFEPTKKSFEENLMPIYQNQIPILPSGLKESEAAILGAASLIWGSVGGMIIASCTP
jgi:glucokinase